MIAKESGVEKKEGWQQENWRMPGLVAFTRRTSASSRPGTGEGVRYDSLSELHYSGGSPESYGCWLANQQLPDGLSITSEAVDVLYDSNGAPTQIHGYINLNRGQGTDVYLTGRALEDYLGA